MSFNPFYYTAQTYPMRRENGYKHDIPQYDIDALLMNDSLPSQLPQFYYSPNEECLDQQWIGPPVDYVLNQPRENPSSEKKYVCPVCEHRSKRRHNMIEHMLTHDPNRPKLFSCGLCHRPFARKYDMKRHEKIHFRN